MFVVQVSPLIRGTKLESLSYFSGVEYPVGSFIAVPIRGKKQPAIVTESRSVSATKAALKAASFSLRKLPTQPDPVVLPQSIRTTAEVLATQYPASVGSLLFALLPPDVRSGAHAYPRVSEPPVHQEETTPQLLTARVDERYVIYQSIIRSTFAHKGSVLLVVPTAVEVEYARKELRKGIDDRLVVFSTSQTKKQRTEAYQKCAEMTGAKLIIATPSHAYIERPNLLTIIVEQSASAHYQTRQRPYLDHRDSLRAYAKVTGRSIVFGDTVPRTEDEMKRRDELFLTYGEEVKRIAFAAPLSVISQRDRPSPEMPFKLFSDELVTSVVRALEGKGKVFFYAARRGLAPVVACIDCGYIFRCPDSNTPYSLVRTTKNGVEERWFVSSTSGRREKAADVCVHCGGWRLRERGIGIQQVHDEWLKLFPDTNVTVLDNITAATPRKALLLAKEFFKQRSGLLIGTQLALPFLSSGVDVSAVISLDAARTIPTWRADESLFRLLLRLRECTAKEVLVQTRTEIDNLLIHSARGALERFYDDEIALRKMLQYPPYSTFYLLTWVGTGASVLELGKPVQELLKEFSVQFYNNPNSTPTKMQRHGLLRVPLADTELKMQVLVKLRALPPYVKVEVNPERIV